MLHFNPYKVNAQFLCFFSFLQDINTKTTVGVFLPTVHYTNTKTPIGLLVNNKPLVFILGT
jgi:hypothetical protein